MVVAGRTRRLIADRLSPVGAGVSSLVLTVRGAGGGATLTAASTSTGPA